MQITCLLALLMFCGVHHVATDSRDPASQIEKTEATVHESFQKFQQTQNDTHLYEARRSIDTLTYQWQHNKQVSELAFGLELEMLDLAFTAHDEAYDVKNPPHFTTKVSPGLGPGLWPGMDPKDIKDTAVREKYEEDIAENNRRRAKYRLEKVTQEFIQSGFEIVRGYVRTARIAGEGDKTIATIRARIKNPVLLKKIEDEMLATSETEKKE